jgi:predicted TIM-barrel fold metal-dependent hydrolase
MPEIPRIISVDDHVIEPPNVWQDRLPERLRGVGPRIERRKIKNMSYVGGHFSYEAASADEEGTWCDWWLIEDLQYPLTRLSAAAGYPRDEITVSPITMDDMRPGCWKQKERLEDMDANHVEASICFPNVLPRFCGQTFLERDDKELALLCVQAYNDWMIDEWCAGDGQRRLIPLTIVPLWDAQLAAAEVRRCADKGSHAVAFSENPFHLGLPSVHDKDRFWDPFFGACEETESVLNMHIGSSSKMPSTSPDSPFIVSSTLTFQNAMGSMIDYIFAGTFDRFPNLVIAYSEGQVGWMPYVLERADKLWSERIHDETFGSTLSRPPSSYVPGHIYGCMFDDEVGLKNRDIIGMDQITFEVDFPHADSTFPHSKDVATTICDKAGLTEAERYKLMRGNAINAYGLERFGITE